MVRAVVGDETQVEAYVDSLFVSRLEVQVGLLIGKLKPLQEKVLGLVKTLGNPQAIDYLTLLDGSGGTGDIQRRQNVAAVVTLTAVVHARAYASTRETFQRAIMDLKKDVISSLRSRRDLLCDEAERVAEDAQSFDKESDGSSVKSSLLSQFSRPRLAKTL